ncbi:hypothetical protein LCGC14_0370550 [marine sediment metagenome]|uniref:Uncharacterized protein n=1 Tax=marine sediment metagenome TaxID=412755 RepID=A0A0F9TB36_9ZZZZ
MNNNHECAHITFPTGNVAAGDPTDVKVFTEGKDRL